MKTLLTGHRTGLSTGSSIDTPPILAVTDAVILAPLVSGVGNGDRFRDDSPSPGRLERDRDDGRPRAAKQLEAIILNKVDLRAQ